VTKKNCRSISSVIAYWNRNMRYNKDIHRRISAIKGISGSCHAFTLDILHAIEVKSWATNTPIAKHLRSIKYASYSQNIIHYTDSLGNPKEFKNYKELDDYITIYNDKISKEELELLFAIDRAFILRGESRFPGCNYVKYKKSTFNFQL